VVDLGKVELLLLLGVRRGWRGEVGLLLHGVLWRDMLMDW